MASSEGAKWFVSILLYFTFMLFIVGVVNTEMDTDIGDSVDTSGTYCGEPRNVYEQFNTEPLDQSSLSWFWENYYRAHIDCGRSAGILSQSACENIDGCVWDDPSNWFQQLIGLGGVDTCTGSFNHSFLITSQYGLIGQGVATYELLGEDTNLICTLPDVINNQTLCEEFSCTWKYRDSINDFEAGDVEPKLSMLGSIWEVTKDMVSFKFSFGFDDSSANFILNFLLFYLPLIGLGLSIYVMVRS